MTVKDIVIDQEPTETIVDKGDWSWSNQTSVPPNSKQIRTNTGEWTSATSIAVTTLDDLGVDRTEDLAALKIDDVVRLEHHQDPARFGTFLLTGAPVNQTDYFVLPVLPQSQGGTIPNSGTELHATAKLATATGNVTRITADFTTSDVNVITQQIADDLVHLIAAALQTVSHLVVHADFAVYVQGGGTISYSFDIKPAVAGEEFPPSA